MTQITKEILIQIQREQPYILNVTNYFPMDLIASGLRSIGAFPLMSNAEQELDELLCLARAVVINLGKLDDQFITLCHRICQSANDNSKPIILNPVGAGLTHYRTTTSLRLIKDHRISIIRGSVNELESLGSGQLTDPLSPPLDENLYIEKAKRLSQKNDMAVVVSGKFNIVIDGDKIDQFNYDSYLLQKVAGIDSLLAAIIGAFHAIEKDRFNAARTAIDFYGNCVGSATSRARGPGSLRAELLDKLFINSIAAMEW